MAHHRRGLVVRLRPSVRVTGHLLWCCMVHCVNIVLGGGSRSSVPNGLPPCKPADMVDASLSKKDVCGTQHTHLPPLPQVPRKNTGRHVAPKRSVCHGTHPRNGLCLANQDTMARDTVQVLHIQIKKTQHEMFERLEQVLRTFAFAYVLVVARRCSGMFLNRNNNCVPCPSHVGTLSTSASVLKRLRCSTSFLQHVSPHREPLCSIHRTQHCGQQSRSMNDFGSVPHTESTLSCLRRKNKV